MQKALFYVKIKIREYFGQVFHMKYLLFSDFLMQKMPSFIKYTWNNSLHFNFLPWKAIFSLINVKFSLMKTLVFLLKPCFSWSKFCNFLLFNRTFLRYSRSKNGLSSTLLGEALTWMSESTEITVSSKFLSETCAGIPETTILFLLRYCFNPLTEDSLDMISFSSLLHFSPNCLFPFWAFSLQCL